MIRHPRRPPGSGLLPSGAQPRGTAPGRAHLVDLLHVGAALVNAMLQDELLQEHEGALVVRMLPYLQKEGASHNQDHASVKCLAC